MLKETQFQHPDDRETGIISTVLYAESIPDEETFAAITRNKTVPYLFVGLVQTEDTLKTYYADTNRHASLKYAIEQDLGEEIKDKNWQYGQMPIHRGRIDMIHFGHAPGETREETEEKMLLLTQNVARGFLDHTIIISFGRTVTFYLDVDTKNFELVEDIWE